MSRFADNLFGSSLTSDGVLANRLSLIPDDESNLEADVLEKKRTPLMAP